MSQDQQTARQDRLSRDIQRGDAARAPRGLNESYERLDELPARA
jgi:hypothetical protein